MFNLSFPLVENWYSKKDIPERLAFWLKNFEPKGLPLNKVLESLNS